MGAKTGIEWTGATWSPNKGCERVSPGCQNCYAERLAGRFCGTGLPMEGFAELMSSGARWTRRVELDPERLAIPLRWKRPRSIFVNSQSDTFHEKLSVQDIACVFGAMAAAPQHTFQVLTKRSRRMVEWFAWLHCELVAPGLRFVVPALIEHAAARARAAGHEDVADRLCKAANDRAGVSTWPLPNVLLGVSVEGPDWLSRVDDLLSIRNPAGHFVSAEPLLAGLTLKPHLASFCKEHDFPGGMCTFSCPKRRQGLSWVIVGGESGGANARSMDVAWARKIVRECKAAGVACFIKQLGAYPHSGEEGAGWAADFASGSDKHWRWDDRPVPHGIISVYEQRHKKGGDPEEWPLDLRVRELPEVLVQRARDFEALEATRRGRS